MTRFLDRFRWVAERRARRQLERDARAFDARVRFVCPHDDYLCDKYGCPEDPGWKGDRK